MAELLSDKRIKPIAFYLPQFHSIPENDLAWGKGFTEWTNVKKAEPLFNGHYQPRVPLNGNYYNLLNNGVMEWQSELAQEYGIFGFCYYHYWFKDGKKLLEKPIENMLQNKDITIPFCLSWANENWTKRWDGKNDEIIAEQDYGSVQDWQKHLEYLVQFFLDGRYIRFNGKPIFIIYRPDEIPNLDDMLFYWNQRIVEYGIDGICFMSQNGEAYYNPSFKSEAIDYQIKFEPAFSNNLERRTKMKTVYKVLAKFNLYNATRRLYQSIKKNGESLSDHSGQSIINYDTVWNSIINADSDDYLIEGAFVDWDNTPRVKNGYRVEGSTPAKFELYLSQLFNKIIVHKEFPAVFINAWNEWAEGAYLEPDERYEYAYLEAVKKTVETEVNDFTVGV